MKRFAILILLLLSLTSVAQDSPGIQSLRPRWLSDGLIVEPVDYRGFISFHHTEILPAMQDRQTKFTKKAKGFGTYVFDFDKEIVQFWAKGQIVGQSEMFYVNGIEDTLCHIISIHYDPKTNKSTTYKFFVFWGTDLDLTFAVWWFDDEHKALRGEISERARISILNRE